MSAGDEVDDSNRNADKGAGGGADKDPSGPVGWARWVWRDKAPAISVGQSEQEEVYREWQQQSEEVEWTPRKD